MSNIVHITYSNPTDIIGTDESIHYSEAVTMSFGLVGEMVQAPTENEVDKKKQGVLNIPVETVTLQKVEFSVHVTDNIKKVVENLVHHKTVTFEFEGQIYTAQIPVEVSFEYLTGIDLMKCKIQVAYAYTVSRDSTVQQTINIL